MNPFTYYLISLTLISSFHLVGMDSADMIAHDPDDELYKMGIEFLTHPQRITQFKNRRPVTLLPRTTMRVAPEALPVANQPVTIAEVERHPQSAIPVGKPVKKRVPQTDVNEELLIPIQMFDVEHNLALFKSESEHGRRYHVRCERCSREKSFFLSGKTFTAAYCALRAHLKKTHKLSNKQLLIEVPPRGSWQLFNY